jgi:hypothetical protein
MLEHCVALQVAQAVIALRQQVSLGRNHGSFGAGWLPRPRRLGHRGRGVHVVIVAEKHVEDGLAGAKTNRALVALQVLRYCNRNRNSPVSDVTLLRSKDVNDAQMNLKLSCQV